MGIYGPHCWTILRRHTWGRWRTYCDENREWQERECIECGRIQKRKLP